MYQRKKDKTILDPRTVSLAFKHLIQLCNPVLIQVSQWFEIWYYNIFPPLYETKKKISSLT